MDNNIGVDLMNLAVNSMPEGLDVVDSRLVIKELNNSFRKVFGNDAIGKKCYEVYKDDKTQCLNCPLKEKVELGQTRQITVDGINGGKTYRIDHTVVRYGTDFMVVEVFTDLTELISIQRQLKKLSDAMVNRELKMVEMKKRLSDLGEKIDENTDQSQTH